MTTLQHSYESQLLSKIMKTATENEKSGKKKMMTLLLKQRESDVMIYKKSDENNDREYQK